MSTRELEHHFADLGEVTIHYVTAGAGLADGPPIVLVHGWPQTWYEWRHVMPRLAARHPVIALDMRGLGDSSRPLDGYDKRTVAGAGTSSGCSRSISGSNGGTASATTGADPSPTRWVHCIPSPC